MNKGEGQSRRKFLGKALGVLAVAVVSPQALLKPRKLLASNPSQTLSLITVNLAKFPALYTVGGSIATTIPGTLYHYPGLVKPLVFRYLLTRTGDTTFLAEEGYCTHQQAPLNPYNGTTINCVLPASGGHGSQYQLDGTVLPGSPSKRNLAIYPTTYDSAKNTVTIDVSDLNLSAVKATEFETALYQNYPNPVKSLTTIRFKLAMYANVSLVVRDMLGHVIAVLTDGYLPEGEHSFEFDASIWNSGIYFYQLTVDGEAFTKQMIVAK